MDCPARAKPVWRGSFLENFTLFICALTPLNKGFNPVALSRDAWLDMAQKAGCPAVEIETICSDKQEHQWRVENRCADLPGFILPSWRDVVNRDYEPWDREHLVVDTAHKNIDACLNEIITWLHAKQKEQW